MTRAGKRRLLMVLGSVFLVLGVLGLVLPILQGVLFLAVGLVLLARAHPRFRLLKMRLRRRYPRHMATFDRAEACAAAMMRGEFPRRRRGAGPRP